MIEVAFYKYQKPRFSSDWWIRTWTGSKYSHCEIVIDGMQYSSSMQDGGVRSKPHKRDDAKWDYIKVTGILNDGKIKELFVNESGCGYDFKGIILSEILPFDIHSIDKWYCSEICAEALKVGGYLPLAGVPSTMSPQKLFEIITQGDRR